MIDAQKGRLIITGVPTYFATTTLRRQTQQTSSVTHPDNIRRRESVTTSQPASTMAPTPPTATLPLAALPHAVLPRQDAAPPTATVTVVPSGNTNTNNDNGSSSSNNSLDTGAIVGIVIGVIVAILLIVWAIKSLSGKPAPDSDRQGWYDDDNEPPRSRRHHHHHNHGGHGGHGGHRSRSRSHHSHHHRHRSRTPRPVVVEKDNYVPVQPPAAYVYPPDGGRRSRSQRRSRSRSGGYYASY